MSISEGFRSRYHQPHLFPASLLFFIPFSVIIGECTEQMGIKPEQLSVSSGIAENGSLMTNKSDLWQADDSDQMQSLTVTLEEMVAITGFVLRTKTVLKIEVQSSLDGKQYKKELVRSLHLEDRVRRSHW